MLNPSDRPVIRRNSESAETWWCRVRAEERASYDLTPNGKEKKLSGRDAPFQIQVKPESHFPSTNSIKQIRAEVEVLILADELRRAEVVQQQHRVKNVVKENERLKALVKRLETQIGVAWKVNRVMAVELSKRPVL